MHAKIFAAGLVLPLLAVTAIPAKRDSSSDASLHQQQASSLLEAVSSEIKSAGASGTAFTAYVTTIAGRPVVEMSSIGGEVWVAMTSSAESSTASSASSSTASQTPSPQADTAQTSSSSPSPTESKNSAAGLTVSKPLLTGLAGAIVWYGRDSVTTTRHATPVRVVIRWTNVKQAQGTGLSFPVLGVAMEQPQVGTRYRARRTRGRRTFNRLDSPTSEAPPPKKMRKKVQDDPEKDAGKLKKLLDMPQDIFFEIASHLYPVDLLQLVKVSRNLREFLLRRSSRHIWIVSLRKISPPPPPCPGDYSEAKYAHLLFGSICFVCSAERAWQVDWTLRMRFCLSCWKANTITGTILLRAFGIEQWLRPDIFNLLPNASTGSRITSSSTTNQNTELSLYKEVKQDQRDHFYRPEFVAVLTQCQGLGTNEAALRDFIDLRKKNTLERLNFRVSIEVWKRDTKESKKLARRKLDEARENAIAERRQAIREKLLELGYESEDFPSWSSQYERLTRRTRPLTPQGWNQIRLHLTTILDIERDTRWARRRGQIEEHYRDFLVKDHEQDGLTGTLPVVKNAMELPCVKALITAKPTPWKGAPVDHAEFMAIVPTLLAEAEEEEARFRQHAVRLLRYTDAPTRMDCAEETSTQSAKAKGKQKATQEDLERDLLSTISIEDDLLTTADDDVVLDLPSSVFECCPPDNQNVPYVECHDPMYFPTFLEHWRILHSHTLLTVDNIRVHPVRWDIPLVLAVFGVPDPATLRELLTSGYPYCSCGKLADAFENGKPEDWTRKLQVLSEHMACARADTELLHIMRIVSTSGEGALTQELTSDPSDHWPWQWVEELQVWRWR
ncbi:hypothetical protein C8Q78DRAFT_993523 [Trametes maxima]|nr:hypothetical protein C8Q78DRAFT_993523 [Trametes maxima]